MEIDLREVLKECNEFQRYKKFIESGEFNNFTGVFCKRFKGGEPAINTSKSNLKWISIEENFPNPDGFFTNNQKKYILRIKEIRYGNFSGRILYEVAGYRMALYPNDKPFFTLESCRNIPGIITHWAELEELEYDNTKTTGAITFPEYDYNNQNQKYLVWVRLVEYGVITDKITTEVAKLEHGGDGKQNGFKINSVGIVIKYKKVDEI